MFFQIRNRTSSPKKMIMCAAACGSRCRRTIQQELLLSIKKTSDEFSTTSYIACMRYDLERPQGINQQRIRKKQPASIRSVHRQQPESPVVFVCISSNSRQCSQYRTAAKMRRRRKKELTRSNNYKK